MKLKSVHFRIDDRLLERFESALAFEGLSKTQVLTNAIQNFCVRVEEKKLNGVKRQYELSDPLKIRMATHREFEERRVNLDEESLKVLRLTGQESILDVGCGPGKFLRFLRSKGHQGHLVGLDQSQSMIREASKASADAKQTIDWIVGNADKLPFANHSQDWVVARHMLYHMPHVRKTLCELKRVLHPAGGLLAATNSRRSLPRILDLTERMLDEFGFPANLSAIDSFCIENAKGILQNAFHEVSEMLIENALVFTQEDPIVNYISSMFPSLNIPAEVELWSEMKQWLKEEARKAISHLDGVWRDPKNAAIYSCRN